MRFAKGWVLGVIVALLLAVVSVQVAGALTPKAAPPTAPPIDWSAVQPGADASWPACTPPHGTKHVLPLAKRPAFVIVGVNDGLPGTRSACIARELAWAGTVTGGSTRPPLEYYVMAADPGRKAQLKWVPHPRWPSSNRVGTTAVRVPAAFASGPHGTTCTGDHASAACAYVYGWTMATIDAALPGLRSPARHRFWIDVETVDDWAVHGGEVDQRFNQAVVEGMAAAFTAAPIEGGVGTTVGIYSDHGEWARIIGRLRSGSPLDRLDEWLAIGPAGHAAAVDALLHDWPLTPGGRIRMVQYLDGAIDRDLARPAADG